MKKKVKILLLPLFIFLVTACFTETNNLEEVFKNMDKLTSYHMTMVFDIGMKGEGVSIDFPVTSEGDFDLEAEVSKTVTSASVMGINTSSTKYTDLKNNISYTQDSEDPDTWIESKEDDIDQDFSFDDKKFKKIGSTNEEIHYQITLTPDEFQENFNSVNEDNGFIVEKDITLDLYINKKENLVSRMEMDLTGAFGNVEQFEITKAKITITFSEFNNVSLSPIEQYIIDTAIKK